MRCGGDEISHGVAAVLVLAHSPGDVAAKQTAAGRARALASNDGELRGRVGELVKVGNGLDEGGESSSGRGQTSGCGKVVLGDNLQGKGRQLGKRGVGSLEGGSAGAQLAEAGLGSRAGDIRGLAIEEEAVVARVGGGAGGGGEGAQVVLRERYGERAVGGEVELGITLAPVSARLKLAVYSFLIVHFSSQ